MAKKVTLILVLASLIAATLFFVSYDTASAQGLAQEGDLTNAFDFVLEYLTGITQSVIGFIVFLGGVVFTVAFVLSATRGSIGQAIGNTMQVSNSIVTALTALIAFIFMIASFRIAVSVSQSLTDEFLSGENFDIIDVSSLEGDESAADYATPEEVLQSAELQSIFIDFAGGVIKFLIGVGTLAFFIGVVKGAFDTQLGALIGGGHMASLGITRAFGALASFVFLISSFAISQAMINSLVPRLLTNIVIEMP